MYENYDPNMGREDWKESQYIEAQIDAAYPNRNNNSNQFDVDLDDIDADDIPF